MRRINSYSEAEKLITECRYLELDDSPIVADKIQQVFNEAISPYALVQRILKDVKEKGDSAVRSYTEKIDHVLIKSFEVPQEEIDKAYEHLNIKLKRSLEIAADRIRQYHNACKPSTGINFINPILGRQILPMERVGIYVPGGTAAYPSTVLMTAIPASVAGVPDIIMVSPPSKDGNIPEPTLAAAKIAQVHRVFKIGGAQAIASLAYGTESVPKVDKICGPGNVFVTLAKKMVFGNVSIDGLAGPSEVFIVADDSANPDFCASDLIAQAEHDILASCVLVTTSASLADRVDEEIDRQLIQTKRNNIAQKALENGYIVVVDDIEQAINLVNKYAAEHVSLMCKGAPEMIPKIRNAGCIFVGEYSPVAFGYYIAGPSHVLPTSGTARFSSPLGVDDFLKTNDIIKADQQTLQELGEAAISIAENEKLYGHAKTIETRLVKTYDEKTR